MNNKVIASDSKNIEIVRLLQKNPRMSIAELARKIGMSNPAAKERVLRLEKSGLIAGYRLEVAQKVHDSIDDLKTAVEAIQVSRAMLEVAPRGVILASSKGLLDPPRALQFGEVKSTIKWATRSAGFFASRHLENRTAAVSA